MPITPKAYRTMCSRNEHKINREISNLRQTEEVYWRMTVCRRYRNHRYYKREYRKLRTREIAELIFAKDSHKSTVPVEDANGNTRTEYQYATSAIIAINDLISVMLHGLEHYQRTLKKQVVGDI